MKICCALQNFLQKYNTIQVYLILHFLPCISSAQTNIWLNSINIKFAIFHFPASLFKQYTYLLTLTTHTMTALHTNHSTHWPLNTLRISHTDHSTHWPPYTLITPHNDCPTQANLHTDRLTHLPPYTLTALHTDHLTHCLPNTMTVLHTDCLTH